jgi:hypothetical protein
MEADVWSSKVASNKSRSKTCFDDTLVCLLLCSRVKFWSLAHRAIVEYVTCKTCRSPDTELSKGENRLWYVTCNSCASRRLVVPSSDIASARSTILIVRPQDRSQQSRPVSLPKSARERDSKVEHDLVLAPELDGVGGRLRVGKDMNRQHAHAHQLAFSRKLVSGIQKGLYHAAAITLISACANAASIIAD